MDIGKRVEGLFNLMTVAVVGFLFWPFFVSDNLIVLFAIEIPWLYIVYRTVKWLRRRKRQGT